MTDHELEQRVRAWYLAEVGAEAAPDDLRDGLMTITRTTVPVRRLAGRRGATLLAAAALLVVGGAIVGGSGLVRLPSVVPPAPLPGPSAAVVPTASAVPSSASQSTSPSTSASPTPDRGAPAQPGMLAGLRQFHLVSDTVGWVSTDTALYRSTDMGTTWIDTRAPKLSPTSTIQVVDAETVYVAAAGSPTTVAATHDGGSSWVTASIELPLGSVGPWLSFPTSSTGYATFAESEEAWDRLLVYATTDRGTTWTGPVHATAPSLGMGYNKIQGPTNGVLWLSNGKADDKPFDDLLAMTTDGGATWTDGSFPIDRFAPGGVLKWPMAIRAEPVGQVILGVAVDGGHQGIYVSSDAGASWRMSKAFTQPALSDYEAQFLSPTTWVMAAPDGSDVWSTSDAGGHWRRTIGDHRLLLTTSFGSPDHAWAMHDCLMGGHRPIPGPDPFCDGSAVTSVFLASTDGGRTWSRVGD